MKILALLAALALFGCSAKTKTEAKTPSASDDEIMARINDDAALLRTRGWSNIEVMASGFAATHSGATVFVFPTIKEIKPGETRTIELPAAVMIKVHPD